MSNRVTSPMTQLLSPKQVARAIDVSESSVKRWCDKGVIATQYTAGGHRRIPPSELVQFLKSTGRQLRRPEVVGWPVRAGQSPRTLDRAAHDFAEALLVGDSDRSRRVVIDLFLADHSVASICDLVMRRAMIEIGDLWSCGDAEVYQERRGCELAARVLHELRGLMKTPPPKAPLAIGGSPSGDHYQLAGLMIELVARECGWNCVVLGANLPFETLAAAIRDYRPRVFWLSCSHLADERAFLEGYAALREQFGADVAFAVGGRALNESLLGRIAGAAHSQDMRGFAAFLNSLDGAPPA